MEQAAFGLVTQLRQANISAEIYPDNTKMDKQMKYANAKKIGFVAFVGEEELAQNQVKVKNMLTGEQTLINQNQLAQILGN
jgi:histidyl-tRNA synthetase